MRAECYAIWRDAFQEHKPRATANKAPAEPPLRGCEAGVGSGCRPASFVKRAGASLLGDRQWRSDDGRSSVSVSLACDRGRHLGREDGAYDGVGGRYFSALVTSGFVAAQSCSPQDWQHVEQDLLWTTELDSGAKDCVNRKVRDERRNSHTAVAMCNPGLERVAEGSHSPDRMSEQQRRWFRCGTEACNWLISSKLDAGLLASIWMHFGPHAPALGKGGRGAGRGTATFGRPGSDEILHKGSSFVKPFEHRALKSLPPDPGRLKNN